MKEAESILGLGDRGGGKHTLPELPKPRQG